MSKKRLLLLIPVFFLTSCGGYSTSYLVNGEAYNSPIFQENYYTHWDDEFKDAVKVSKAVDVLHFDELFKIDAQVFEKYSNAREYGKDYRMNSVNEMFNYGVQSKLFDGQMVCGAQDGHPEKAYQLARVQINTDGFSMRFSKESDDLKYFAFQYKATTDNTVQRVYKVGTDELAKIDADMYHNSTVNLSISLYTKTDDGIVNNEFTFSEVFEAKTTNRGDYYKFTAFDLRSYNLSRLIGISVKYTFDDELINWNKEKGVDIDYALFLYEMFIPHTSWH